jgi:hypothetical protein
MNTHLNRKTVVRKLLYLSKQAELRLEKINRSLPPAQIVEFDDLITFEHTKCKPLAVTLMVEHRSRRILGFEVAKIAASGHLAKFSLKKYGKRPDQRFRSRKKLFNRVKNYVAPDGVIKSDQESHYGPDVKRHFPHCRHETHKSIRASVAGLGELKKTYRDPIFSINQTLAMLRANINRLFRRTWCTTKRPDRLAAHLMIYCVFHNEKLI